MSRIHEAMQKAAQERAAAPATEIAPFPFDAEPAPERELKTVASASPNGAVTKTQISTSAATSPGPLQFEDLQRECARPKWHPDPRWTVFSNPALNTLCAEQFRTLRSRLYQLRASQRLGTILITSALPGEGKTFVAANLAQAIVRQAERRVLIIDADLRSSRLHGMLGAPAAPGLSDYLRGDVNELAVTQSGQEGNLWFIPGGTKTANPSELLSNGRLKSLLDHMAPFFDWIILDSPPCLPVMDANVVADFCDGLLFVVKAGSTPAEIAQRARQELEGRNLLGVVLNAVNDKALAYGSYYNHGYGNDRVKEPMKGKSD